MHAKKRHSQPGWAIDGDITCQLYTCFSAFDPKYVGRDYTGDR